MQSLILSKLSKFNNYLDRHHYCFSLVFFLLILNISDVSAINAQTSAKPDSVTTNYQATPANLVVLARNGYFQQQGIPSHLALSAAYNLGRVTAFDIVRAGVQAKRISSEYLSDRSFLKAVAAQLEIRIKVH